MTRSVKPTKNKNPVKGDKLLTPKEAVAYAAEYGIKTNGAAMRYWFRKENVGKKIFGKWFIEEKKLNKILGITE